jgi:hypothetical protein
MVRQDESERKIRPYLIVGLVVDLEFTTIGVELESINFSGSFGSLA